MPHPFRWKSALLALVSLLACACVPSPPARTLQPVPWKELVGWEADDPGEALAAFRGSCRALGRKPLWEPLCAEAAEIDPADSAAVRSFFEEGFSPYRLQNPEGGSEGLITGYYVPVLPGSREPSERFAHPLYRRPEEMLTIDLGDLYPELKGYRLRGRLEGNRVVPYFSRAEIDGDRAPLEGEELLWVDDPVDLFFLHVQGSGLIRLESGERLMVNYADQNGHPYRSIGRDLIREGEVPKEQMSLQGIKAWAERNPQRVAEYLNRNPSYVFFRELPSAAAMPPGALGVPLTPGRSLAVDRRFIPLGAPVFLATTRPMSEDPLQRLMVAQDTGGAIKGQVRADFFWGLGEEAGALAGRMKQSGTLWLLWPRGAVPPGTEPQVAEK